MLLLAFLAAVTDPVAPAVGVAEPASTVPPEVRASVDNCGGHKFETTVEALVDGKPRKSTIKLCGNAGQTDEGWVRTLRSAVTAIQANRSMPASAKEQAIIALTAEIEKTEAHIAAVAPALGPVAATPVEPGPVATIVAPLPAAPAATTIAAPAVATPVVARAPDPPRPRLKIECYTPGDIGSGGPCMTIERDTLLIVEAVEGLTGPTAIQLERRGGKRGQLTVAPMGKGESRRLRIPAELCAGGGAGRLELRIYRAAGSSAVADRLVDTRGPYLLRC